MQIHRNGMEGNEKRCGRRQVICVILGICIAAVLTGVITAGRMDLVEARVEKTQKTLAKEVFRFHVLANSDSSEDQAVKLKVRDAILSYMKDSMVDEPNAEETEAFAASHLEEIEAVAKDVLQKEGYDYGCSAEVTTCYFPDKRYGDIVFPSGDYRALRVKLGKADGQNWWCVLYPGLCFENATCAVVSDEGKRELKEALTAEEYEMVTAAADFKIKWFFFGGDSEK